MKKVVVGLPVRSVVCSRASGALSGVVSSLVLALVLSTPALGAAAPTTPTTPNTPNTRNVRVCVEVALSRPLAAPPKLTPTPTPTPPEPPTPATAAPPRPTGPALQPAGTDADLLPEWGDAKARTGLPLGQRPLSFLKRLLEYYVSHEKGFVAVPDRCEQTIRVEMYSLVDGWTAFVRYTGTGREERVDRLLPNELSPFAERAAKSLLYGKPISATIDRGNVLDSDSREYTQLLRGTHHFILGIGTDLRAGRFATAVSDPGDPRNGQSVTSNRFFSPVSFFMGYRGRYESWGLEANALAAVGTAQSAVAANPAGGHIDLVGAGGAQLHFLHYFEPRGLVSFYLGGGSTFELLWFQATRPADARQEGSRGSLFGGGLDVDLVAGWEFMRASTAQFFLQGDLRLPAYVLSTETNSGALHSWFPGVGLKLGVLF